jgi:hypothetical protein
VEGLAKGMQLVADRGLEASLEVLLDEGLGTLAAHTDQGGEVCIQLPVGVVVPKTSTSSCGRSTVTQCDTLSSHVMSIRQQK